MNKSRRLFYLTLLVTVVVLLNVPGPASRKARSAVRDGLAPFQNALAALRNGGHRLAASLRAVVHADDEKAALARETAALRLEVRRLRALDRENRELRRLLGFRRASHRTLLPAEVIGRGDTTGWWRTILLNRGSADGLSTNLAVITMDGLVGRILEVSRHTSRVLLITDPQCRISGRLKPGVFGIVHGRGSDLRNPESIEMLCPPRACAMDYLPRDKDVAPGAEVVTSGLGGTYPPGLLIGHVTRVTSDPMHLYRKADVAPAADLRALRFVFVVLPDSRTKGTNP